MPPRLPSIPRPAERNGAPQPKRHPRPRRLETEKNFGLVFERLGVELLPVSSGQAEAEECPFCGKDRFHVETRRGDFLRGVREDVEAVDVDRKERR